LLWIGWSCLLVNVSSRVRAQTGSAKPTAADPSDGSSDADYASQVQAAVKSFNDGEFEAARAYFGRAHALKPSARTWRGLGASAFELGNFSDAVRELSFALEDTRSALTPAIRDETELMLRVARRRTGENVPDSPATAAVQDGSVHLETDESDRRPAGPGLSTQRILSVVAGAVGLAGIGVGIGFSLQAMSDGIERDKHCNGSSCRDSRGVEAAHAAITAGNISTVAWIVGGVGLAAGSVLWLTEPADEPAASARLGIGPGSVQLQGQF
jgi:tetratricopeptide (TPR) repeat protein